MVDAGVFTAGAGQQPAPTGAIAIAKSRLKSEKSLGSLGRLTRRLTGESRWDGARAAYVFSTQPISSLLLSVIGPMCCCWDV